MPALPTTIARVVVLAPRPVEAAAPAFSPADVAGLTFWFDADAITGLANNDPVTSWTDESGNSHTATQADSGKQPLYKTNVQNGLPGVLFDNTNDCLQTPAVNLTGTQKVTYFAVVKFAASGANNMIFESSAVVDSNEGAIQYLRTSGDVLRAGYNGNAGATNLFSSSSSTTTSTVLSTVIHDLTRSSNEITHYHNGGSASNGGGAVNNTDAGMGNYVFNIGARNNGASLPMNGHLFELILYTDALSDTDRAAVRDYLNDKWAVY